MSGQRQKYLTAGDYRITSSASLPWLQTPIKEEDVKTKKRKNQKVIIYPIFNQCKEFISDPFWVQLLEEAGYNKFPRGFSFRENQLVHRRGTRINTVTIPENMEDPQEVVDTIINFMREYGIRSAQDQDEERRLLQEKVIRSMKNTKLTWADMSRKRSSHIFLFEAYANRIKDELDLSNDECKDLITTINIGVFLGYINGNDIDFSDGQIKEINGISFDIENRKFSYINGRKPKKIKSLPAFTNSNDKTCTYAELWKDDISKLINTSLLLDDKTPAKSALRSSYYTNDDFNSNEVTVNTPECTDY